MCVCVFVRVCMSMCVCVCVCVCVIAMNLHPAVLSMSPLMCFLPSMMHMVIIQFVIQKCSWTQRLPDLQLLTLSVLAKLVVLTIPAKS